MKRAYRKDEAERLRPLLESIAREIEERDRSILILSRSLHRMRSTGADSLLHANAVAELAQHKRELRRAHEELTRLGCELDPALPQLVRVPGPDGQLATGFELHLGGIAEPLTPTGAE